MSESHLTVHDALERLAEACWPDAPWLDECWRLVQRATRVVVLGREPRDEGARARLLLAVRRRRAEYDGTELVWLRLVRDEALA